MVEAQHPLVATQRAGIEVQLPFGTHRICAVAAAPTAAEMRKLVRQAMRFSRTIELRLDWLANDAQRQKLMAWLARSGVRANFIATFRHRAAGGRYTGDIAGQLIVLKQAVERGCSWCDVEMETASRFRAEVLRALLGPAKLIISFHDFRRTPRKLTRLVRHLESWGADGRRGAPAPDPCSAPGQRTCLCPHRPGDGAGPGSTRNPAQPLSRRRNFPADARLWGDRRPHWSFAFTLAAQHGFSGATARRRLSPLPG